MAYKNQCTDGIQPAGKRKKYRWILLDADDTVFDFARCQRQALGEVLSGHGIAPTDETVAAYDRINRSLWGALERREIEKPVLIWKRFELLAREIGAGYDPVEISSEYEKRLAGCAFFLPGAAEACRALACGYGLYIITNGIGAVQKARIRDSGLERYLDGVFISGEIGHEKPSKEFFDAVAEAIPGFDPAQTLVVGDSLTSDISGGIACGADTCWINTRGAEASAGMLDRITYVLPSVTKLPGLLRRLESGDDSKIQNTVCRLREAGIQFETDFILAPRTSFRIGGPADIAVFPASPGELKETVRILAAEEVRYITAGNASNLLFSDAGFRGAVLFTSGIKGLSVEGSRIRACAGDSLTAVCRAAREAGLSGIEFAYGIPGSVGGAVYMNAGAYGGQMSDVLESVEMLDLPTGEFRIFSVSEMDFSYRSSLASSLPGRYIVTGAVFSLSPGDRKMIAESMEEFAARRKEKQPLEYPSAGSVFKRPAPDVYVGKLVEEAGLKGMTAGGAEVSSKHAGFIVNRGGASSSDVLSLIETVKKTIFNRTGLKLECEIVTVPEKEEK